MTAAFLVFALTIGVSLAGLFGSRKLVERCLFRPYWLRRQGRWDTAITSGFVHADLAHLLLNMVTFYFFAFPLERHIGGARFLLLYLAGLLLSHAGTYLKHKDNPDYASLGASGAIAAVLFAYIVYFPTATLMILPFPVPIPAPLFALLYVAYSVYSARHARDRINHDAHLWGALAGLAFVAVADPGAYAGLLDFVR